MGGMAFDTTSVSYVKNARPISCVTDPASGWRMLWMRLSVCSIRAGGMFGSINSAGFISSFVNRLLPRAPSLEPITASFKDEGDMILLLGETKGELGGSEYLALIHGRKAGLPPRVDLRQERALQRLMLALAGRGWLKSAHDCSDGGLAVALAECCVSDEQRLIGAVVSPPSTIHRPQIRPDALLFSESAGRIVVSCERRFIEPLLALAKRGGVIASLIGQVGGTRLTISPWIDESVDVLSSAWRTGLSRHFRDGSERTGSQFLAAVR